MAEKFVLISAIEELNKDDTFEDQQWPLHITVMPWFRVPTVFESALVNSLANKMHQIRPMTVIGDKDELFEPHKTVQVRTLRNIGQLASLHTGVLDIINRCGGEVDSVHIRDNYRPHVTYQQGRGVSLDQSIALSDIQLIRGGIQGQRRVEHVFNFLKDRRI